MARNRLEYFLASANFSAKNNLLSDINKGLGKSLGTDTERHVIES